MTRRFMEYSSTAFLGVLFALVSWASLAGENGQQKTVDGVSVYMGVLPAEMLLGHPKGHHEREMHGGVPAGINRYHVVVALFDAASGRRVTEAQVKIGGASIGMAASRKKAEPMLVNNVTTYGTYIRGITGMKQKLGLSICNQLFYLRLSISSAVCRFFS